MEKKLDFIENLIEGGSLLAFSLSVDDEVDFRSQIELALELIPELAGATR